MEYLKKAKARPKAKGATNIFSSIFIIKTSFILSISILSCLPGDINVAKD